MQPIYAIIKLNAQMTKLRKNDMIQNQNDTIMVCVTRQRTCERLVRAGALRAQQTGAKLIVAHAVYQYENIMDNEDEATAMELLFSVTNDYDGEMMVFRCEDKFKGLAECAKKNKVSLMILGASAASADSVVGVLRALLPEVDFVVLEAEQQQAQSG